MTCKLCGGPIRQDNQLRICTRNPACKKAASDIHNARHSRIRRGLPEPMGGPRKPTPQHHGLSPERLRKARKMDPVSLLASLRGIFVAIQAEPSLAQTLAARGQDLVAEFSRRLTE
jgi:hypothetical protein